MATQSIAHPPVIFLAEEGIDTVEVHQLEGPCNCTLCSEKEPTSRIIVVN